MELRKKLQASLGTAYTLERELDGGGMSRVFVAEEASLGRRVVVKVLPSEFSGAVNVDRFRREIQIAGRLQHPCIVAILHADVADGTPFYTMPFVAGQSLRSRLSSEGELSVAEALKVLRDLASALAYAHEHGVIHRDIKPDNVLLSDGYALVTDFGIAKALTEASTNTERLTATGIALGTPAYMSPEQAGGEPNVDHRADIYAFGCVAYEVLVGQPPFAAQSAQAAISAHFLEIPQPVSKHRPSVPSALSALVARCLEKRPADRPQSAREVLRELDAIATPVAGSPSGVGAARPSRRAVWIGIGAVAFAAMAIAIAAPRFRAPSANPSSRRVVVRTFTNSSGDKSLDAFGLMAADWIARGLTETQSVEVAGTEAEIATRDLKETPGAASTTVAIGRLVRARYVVSGSYFVQNDSLVLQAEISDADAGRRVLSVAPVNAPLAARQGALEQLRQRVTGALVPFFDSSLVETNVSRVPPAYDSYKEYLFAEQAGVVANTSAIEHYRAAVALDASFMLARLRLVNALERGLYWASRDSALAELESLRPRLTPYERAALDLRQGIAHRDYDAAYRAGVEGTRLAPQSAYAKYELAEIANLDNRPSEAARLVEPLDPQAGALRGHSTYFTVLCGAYHALHRMKDFERCAVRGTEQYPGQWLQAVRVLGALGNVERLGRALDSMAAVGPTTGAPTTALFELEAHGHAADARRLALRALASAGRPVHDSALATRLGRLRLNLLIFLERWADAARLADSAMAGTQRPEYPLHIARGIAAAKLGDSVEARRQQQAVASLRPNDTFNQQYAGLLAAIGDRDGAVQFLRANAGPAFDWEYHGVIAYRFLRGYPPFEELLKPRG